MDCSVTFKVSITFSILGNLMVGMNYCKFCGGKKPTPTRQEQMLFEELRRLGVVNIFQQYCDGKKHVDIFDKDAGIAIEIDGLQHFGSTQALADLKRAFWSFKKEGVITIHLSNELIEQHLKETARQVAEFLDEAASEFDEEDDYWD